MEVYKAKIITVAAVIFLIVVIVVARICFKSSKGFFLVCGADIAAILAVLIWLYLQYRIDCRRRLLESNSITSDGKELRKEFSFLRKVAGVPTKFRYKELEAATDNFQSLIGQGASASVYKGKLDDGTLVAVKRITAEQHGEKEFRAEVAAIASVQHINLVRLFGYSLAVGGPRFLVYEFIHNGSLDGWIFPHGGRHSGLRGCLAWELRYRVAIDVAKALAYLHHDCRSKILHLDVKPENILLDANFRAIVTDFGLSKLMGKDESRVITTVRGTRGYLAPEWLLQRGVSEKSDVFSYGMVVLEIIGGRRNVRLREDDKERYWSYFPRIVSEKERQGRLMEIVDERLVEKGGGIDEKQIKILVHVALWCIQEDPKLRPTMACVVDMLEGRVVMDQPPETKMVIVDILSINQDRKKKTPLTSSKEESEITPASNGSLSISVLSGR
ncbi:probable receptor-like protein kinase At5g20050 [Macadamia integrifolia]|uniref:probable receptor-like protein kinase At5g20050 n=1 Tax=Macadamia integrifolia TaxID=60698 RepID=UPI001C4EF701|nr:probable receptor-like protein kinase At5g20050 [Macadamia integrifolia]